jgi:TonB family protein
MISSVGTNDKTFKRAAVLSVAAHSLLLLVIIINPSLPKSAPKAMIHYITLNMPGGGGGSGGAMAAAPKTELGATEVKRESLRDLTTLQKLQADEPKSQLRYPVEKPKKEPAKKPEKKAAITKPEAEAKPAAKETPAGGGQAAAGGGGSGLTIGLGGSGAGGGAGGGFPGDLGISNFPYMYYLREIQYKIQSNWFTSLVDPGVSGNFHVDVYFRIYKDGSISTVEIKEPSGLKTLDQSAVRAVMQSAKFGPLPPGYEDEYLGIYLRFEHSK